MSGTNNVVEFPKSNLPLPEVVFMGMVAGAFDAQEEGKSYRGFKVGVMGWSLPDKSGKIKSFRGANTKLAPDKPKDCGEMKVMRAALKASVRLAGLVVVGMPQHDHRSGLIYPTLHPCEECRVVMRRLRGVVITDDTHVITIHPTRLIFLQLTIPKLMAAHGESW